MLSIFNEKVVITAGTFCATMVFGLLPIHLVKYLFDEERLARTLRSEGEAQHRHHHHHNHVSKRRLLLASIEERKARRKAKLKKLISYASCFSGGVFVAACLLDLLPDVHEAFDHVLDEIEAAYHTKVDYPVAEFVVVFGFFLVLILEQIVLDCKEGWPTSDIARQVSVDEHRPLLTSPTTVPSGTYGSTDDQPSTTPVQEDDDDNSISIAFSHPVDHESHHDHDIFGHSVLRSVLLIIALTFHSLFEGLAIGLQEELGQLMSIFIAVVVHKAVMAFSLGLNIAQSNFGAVQSIASIFIFSVSSPLGIALGMILVNMEKSLTGDIANGVLQGIAGGTFLYITFFEVLPHELNAPNNRMQKLMCVLVGCASVCALLFITH